MVQLQQGLEVGRVVLAERATIGRNTMRTVTRASNFKEIELLRLLLFALIFLLFILGVRIDKNNFKNSSSELCVRSRSDIYRGMLLWRLTLSFDFLSLSFFLSFFLSFPLSFFLSFFLSLSLPFFFPPPAPFLSFFFFLSLSCRGNADYAIARANE